MSVRVFPSRRVLWMPLGLAWRAATGRRCCGEMEDALAHECELHADPFECPDTVLVYNEVLDEYGLPIRDGGMGYLVVSHCPWCGARLPESARERWFDAVEAAGLDASDIGSIPEDYLCARWRTTSKS